jgi:hypothetical protein
MGLFERKRFVWNEPWFFQQRIRTKKAWVLFSMLLLLVAVAGGTTMYVSDPPRQPLDYLKVIGMGLGLAAAIWWVLDGANTRRQAILFEDSIVVGGDMGKYSQATTYKLSEIPFAAIVMPEASKWPERALYFLYQGEEQAIGIESRVSLTRLAQALHDAGVRIQLDGWEPNQASELERSFTWQADPRRVVERATMQVLPPDAPSMLTVGGVLEGLVWQDGAIVLGLVIAGCAVYYGYENWANLGLVQKTFLFAIPLGLLYLASQFTSRFAIAASSPGIRRMALGQFRKRAGLQLNPDPDAVIPVNIFTRDQFAKTVQHMHDVGYLQADPRCRRMLYEGKKERWCIPAASIRSLSLEEVQIGTPGQSATGQLHYYVVVHFVADGDQEFGFECTDRDFGKFDDIKRAQGGVRVFEAVESILPPQSGALGQT